MKRTDPTDPVAMSQDLVKADIKKIQGIFPEAVSDDKVDIDWLRQHFGSAVAENEEKFGLQWHGKANARNQALIPSSGTLLPFREESANWDTTRNLMIEGDNLEVLKLLQRSYAGKIKLIYIDPPYNTGKDFIYPDNFKDSISGYLKITGQVDNNGGKLTSNPELSGRFHTDWLNMMYPRLKLARNLLRDDGVFIASISDAEVHNFRCVMDEIFGYENLISCVVWNSTKSVTNTALMSVSHTYNLVYARNRDYFVRNRSHIRLLENGNGFENPDNDPQGPWKADPFQVGGERPNQRYPITNPNTGKVYRPGKGKSWKNDLKKFNQLMAEGRIVFGKKGASGPQRKRYRYEAIERGRVATTWWDEVGTTTDATDETKKLMGDEVFFSPKPVSLIRKFIQLGTHDPQDSIVLDFFAGSGTLGQAVIEQNASDGGNRRYILVQLPEPLDSTDKEQNLAATFCDAIDKPRNMAELTKERLRRASEKMHSENPGFQGDAGFRVFKLAHSNIKQWNPSLESLEQELFEHIDNILGSRSEEDIFFELLLKHGFDLCAPTQERAIADGTAFVTSDNKLIACLAPSVKEADVESIASSIAGWAEAGANPSEVRVVFRDSAFQSDVAKINIAENLAQRGLKEVRSI